MYHAKKLIGWLLAASLLLCLMPLSVSADSSTANQNQPPLQPRQVLQDSLAMLAATVTEPVYGTTAGEWTVFSLARGNYFAKDSAYFADYYNRIVETVNETAASVDLNGALHKSKSTDNSRLIVALSAIGKDATSVGNWDLVEAYSANGINWIKKQGLNGTIWALIALDSNHYITSDPTIRQQCVDSILSLQHNDGGWSLVTAKAQPSNVDITGMTLTALYPYRNQPEVASACEAAIGWLSESQLETGGFPYGKSETSESCAWAIVALTTWGIDPHMDSRFIKNGYSALDNLLSYYIEEEKMFAHQGSVSNAMGTDQACYALVAYLRFVDGKHSLFDYGDVEFENTTSAVSPMAVTLHTPENINLDEGFDGIISIDQWDNQGSYKLLDMIVQVPNGITVTDVIPCNQLNGGQISWNLESDTGKLRIVYFDANTFEDLTITGDIFPVELFTIRFFPNEVMAGETLEIYVSGMSVKCNSDPETENAMVIINTDQAIDQVHVATGISFSAKCLYTGDDVDLISSKQKAIAVSVTGIEPGVKLTYQDDTTTVVFYFSGEMTAKTGVATYIAMVDSTMAMENFVNSSYYTISAGTGEAVTFGDVNQDGVVNAQDALNVVNAWLRKGDIPSDTEILAMNVNGDSRINTFDALAIVEAFINKNTYLIVTKAATI